MQTLASSQLPDFSTCAQPTWVSQASVVQSFLSSQVVETSNGVPMHLPAWHASPLVHALPSPQGATLAPCLQPAVASQESSVHGLASSHWIAWPWHCPPLHASALLHALPSEHTVPLALAWLAHCPVATLQNATRHSSGLAQAFTAPPWHLLAEHASPVVHGLPSSQTPVPAEWAHPDFTSQLSTVQGFSSSQSSGTPTQLPPLQVSNVVHGLASVHAPPS